MVEPLISQLAKKMEQLHDSLLKFEDNIGKEEIPQGESNDIAMKVVDKTQPEHVNNNQLNENNGFSTLKQPLLSMESKKTPDVQFPVKPPVKSVDNANSPTKISSTQPKYEPIKPIPIKLSSGIPKRPSTARIASKRNGQLPRNQPFAQPRATPPSAPPLINRVGFRNRFPRTYSGIRGRGKPHGRYN